jgi:hypothetical protein
VGSINQSVNQAARATMNQKRKNGKKKTEKEKETVLNVYDQENSN